MCWIKIEANTIAQKFRYENVLEQEYRYFGKEKYKYNTFFYDPPIRLSQLCNEISMANSSLLVWVSQIHDAEYLKEYTCNE